MITLLVSFKKMEILPYQEIKFNKIYERTFSCNLSQDDLKWHQDEEDRFIWLIEGDNWHLQLDNCVPQKIEKGKKYFIPKMHWHRLIKGNSDLKIKLKKMEE
jgi:hypothetical protein